MVQINFAQKQVSAKIVYYGPGMSGKTTNLEIVHQRAPDPNKGELTSISTDGDRTLFFDFMPLDLGTVAGMRTCFQIYTVPGQVYYNSTRKLVLQGVDGVVFVADSSAAMMQENLESLRNLEENLNEYGKSLATMPHVIQYNKRDLPDAMAVELLNQQLNAHNAPVFEAIANTGQGVFPTLKALAARVLESIHSSSGAAPATPAARPQAPAAAPRMAAPATRAPAAALPAQQAMPQPAMQRAGVPNQQPAYAQPMHAQPVHGQPMHGQPMHAQPMHGQPPQALTQTGFQNAQQFHQQQMAQQQPPPPSSAGGQLTLAGRASNGSSGPRTTSTARPGPGRARTSSAPPAPRSSGALEGTRFRPRAGGQVNVRPTPTKSGKLPQGVLVAAIVVLAIGVTYALTKFL
jgi:signal recognition particle receptor subunit beta